MKNSVKIVRSTQHTTTFTNVGKRGRMSKFLDEYQRIGQIIIEVIWRDGYREFDVNEDQLELPRYLDYNHFNLQTSLSARALSSLVTQLSGVIRASVEKRKRMLWMRDKINNEGGDSSKIIRLLINPKFKCMKPTFPHVAELSSKCVIFEKGKHSFDYILYLRSLGKEFGQIFIPLKKTSRSLKWESEGRMLGSFLITMNRIEIRWEVESKPRSGETVGADQGMSTVMTLSNGTTTPDTCPHGHSLSTICGKVAGKKKGSKAFHRAQCHRKNFINYSINMMDLSGIGKIQLEKVVHINFGKRTNRRMQAWTNTLIRDKLMRRGEELGVQVTLQDCVYRSQRCSNEECGSVRKANRKGKIYNCKHCGNIMDADLNAARNHAVVLPNVSALRGRRLNLGDGFFWKSTGMFTYDGQEFRVPDSHSKDKFL